MYIESVEMCDYRNYEQLKIDFSDHINIFYGDNAQGKTNLLEAIYLGCTTKSYRGSKEKEIIRFDHDEAHLKLMLDRNGSKYRIDMHLKKNKAKGIAINGIAIRKASELFGIVNVVFFAPEDLSMIKNGPVERRKFMDSELCQLDKIYLSSYSNYMKVLAAKNQVLKDILEKKSGADAAMLDVLDQQLVTYGKQVITIRQQFTEEIDDMIHEIHQKLTGGKEFLEVRYEPSVSAARFGDELLLARDRDIRSGSTSVGPHRDDMCFTVTQEGRKAIDLRKYGSQGQQRTAALSLKMAEIELVKKNTGNAPVLLLDDVLSELDSGRQTQLLQSISGTQTFITCTGLEEFVSNRFQMDRVYYVENGTIEAKNM